LVPGTGNAFAFGSPCAGGGAFGDTLVGSGVAGAAFAPAGAPSAAGLAGLIEALGGTGSFPCWISEAFCATAGGSVGPAPAGNAAFGAALVPSAPG
jgi:hypothetical protein